MAHSSSSGNTSRPESPQGSGNPVGSGPWAPESLVAFGKALKPRGIRGELKVSLLCEGPDHFCQCLESGEILAWKDLPAGLSAVRRPAAPVPSPDSSKPSAPVTPVAGKAPLRAPEPVRIESVRFHAGYALVFLEGVDSVEAAERYRDCLFGLPVEQLPAGEPDSYYHHQLEGLRVVTVQGALLGVIERIEENPAHEQLVVRPAEPGAPLFRIPMVQAFVRTVDLEAGQILVEIPDGLIES
ncbi:MAG TPA: ribosome maturation factor RimM, partial [Candidatus Sumerlaeota bacterium]|nr:ribosome maturation factor RimM [Candidatus Sumerlaeota bacterium]